MSECGCRVVVAVADRTGILRRRGQCQGCGHASKNADPKFSAFGGLTSKSVCGLCQCNIAVMTKGEKAQCPDNPARW